jgi:glycosyltransferase involved in cell wall biosynthesis
MKISVIVRNFNNTATITKALSSIVKQAYPNTEIILVDDGSTDDSLSKIAQFDPFITPITTKHLGPIGALNAGIRSATGEAFTIVDSDDFLPTNALAQLSLCMSEHSADAVYGDYFERNPNSPFECYYQTGNDPFTTLAGGWLIKMNVIRELGLYDESLVFPEYDLLIKMQTQKKIVHLPEPVYYYCRRPDSYTGDKERVKEGVKQLQQKYNTALQIREY